MTTFWKIAPGNHAEDWPLFSELGCIGIGWLNGKDFAASKTKPQYFLHLCVTTVKIPLDAAQVRQK
jgi:hypothetical protein